MSLKHLPFDEADAHDVRVGWSAATTSVTLVRLAYLLTWSCVLIDALQLGESNPRESGASYGYCSIGKKAHCGHFQDFGEVFSVNDTITTILVRTVDVEIK